MKSSGAVIVSWDFSNGPDHDIVLVGDQTKEKGMDIINAFQGQEAREIINKLKVKKEKEGK